MATTVASHSVATFTSPVNGTTPIDANTVRGNDNTIRTAYNTHDADPGIHVQSSTLASRPAAGTAGRKWITEDDGIYTLWFDDGTHWHQVSQESLALAVIATQNLVVGDVVKAVGWNNGQNKLEVAKVSSASDTAFGIATEAITINTQGYVVNTGIVQDVNTAAYTVGTILYPNSSGGLTSTKPTSGNYQPSVYVLRQNTNNGVLYVEFSAPRIVESSSNTASTVVLRDASGNFSAGTITANLTGTVTGNITGNAATATALQTARTINGVSFNGTADITVTAAAGTLTGNTLASGVTASSLTSVGTLSSLTVSGNTKIGGGAASNTSRLMVNTANGTAAGIQLIQDGQASWILQNVASSTMLTLSESGVERMSINGLGNVAFDTNTLYVDAANDRVGIQTATPAYPLQVRRAGGAGSLGISIDSVGTTDRTVQYFSVQDSATSAGAGHAFYYRPQGSTTDTLSLMLDENGRVGIGTASPAGYKLDIVGDTTGVASGNTPALRLRHAGDGGVEARFENGTGALARIVAGVTSAGAGTDDGTLVFATAANSTLTDWMTLASSGNLGIGTASPNAALEVSKASSDVVALQEVVRIATTGRSSSGAGGNNRGTLLSFSDSANTTLTSAIGGIRELPAGNFNGALAFYTNPGGSAASSVASLSERMRLDAAGNLGLGVTPSAWATYRSFDLGQYGYISSGAGGWMEVMDNTYWNGSYRYKGTGNASHYLQQNGIHSWFTAPSGTAGAAITFHQGLTLDANARLNNVAVASQGAQFNLFANAQSSGEITLAQGFSTATDNVGYLFNRSNAAFVFGTNNTERARITSGGYFKASNAGTYNNAAGAYHEFRTSANGQVALFDNTSATLTDENGINVRFTAASPDNNTAKFIVCSDSTTQRMIVWSDGDLANHDGVYGTISDARLKQDIIDATSQWNDIKAVRFRKYRMKTDVAADANAPYQLGVIAQELEQVSPGLVDESLNEDGTTTKMVKSSILLMKAAVALQEAMARIETLEARVAALGA